MLFPIAHWVAAANTLVLPNDISGLRLWLKADAGVLNSGGTAATNGQGVATWQDQSGNGNNATAVTAPTFVASALNSKPTVRAVGTSSQYMTLPANVVGAINTAYSLFAVVVINATPGAYCPVYISRDGPRIALRLSGTKWGTWIGADANAASVLSLATPYLLEMTFNGSGSGAFYKNGTADGTFAGTPGGSGQPFDMLFAEADVGRFVSCDLSEIIAYNTLLSTTDRQAVETYLSAKYALGF